MANDKKEIVDSWKCLFLAIADNFQHRSNIAITPPASSVCFPCCKKKQTPAGGWSPRLFPPPLRGCPLPGLKHWADSLPHLCSCLPPHPKKEQNSSKTCQSLTFVWLTPVDY